MQTYISHCGLIRKASCLFNMQRLRNVLSVNSSQKSPEVGQLISVFSEQ